MENSLAGTIAYNAYQHLVNTHNRLNPETVEFRPGYSVLLEPTLGAQFAVNGGRAHLNTPVGYTWEIHCTLAIGVTSRVYDLFLNQTYSSRLQEVGAFITADLSNTKGATRPPIFGSKDMILLFGKKPLEYTKYVESHNHDSYTQITDQLLKGIDMANDNLNRLLSN